jgi:hypothetical protein
MIRKLGRNPSTAEKLDVARRRERLQVRIETFHRQAAQFMTTDSMDPPMNTVDKQRDTEYIWDSDEETDEEESFFTSSPFHEPYAPEHVPLLLPSNIGLQECEQQGYLTYAQQEFQLRIGQANDALQGLRLALSRKAVIFRVRLRPAKTKKRKLRSWDQIRMVDVNVRHHANIYMRARAAMIRLGATDEDLERYRVLAKEHLSLTTARIEPSLRGQRNVGLAWFWTMDVKKDTDHADGMAECKLALPWSARGYANPMIVYRVHWLKAKARRDRWAEEATLLGHEMDWTFAFFQKQAFKWRERALGSTGGLLHIHGSGNGEGSGIDDDSPTAAAYSSSDQLSRGQICYALRQEHIWLRFAQRARDRFVRAKQQREI